MRISDWSSDVCSSDLPGGDDAAGTLALRQGARLPAGLLQGLGGGAQREMDEAVHLAAVLRRRRLLGIEAFGILGDVGPDTGYPGGQVGRLEARDAAQVRKARSKEEQGDINGDEPGGYDPHAADNNGLNKDRTNDG